MLSRRARVGGSAMSMMPVVLDRPPPICPHLNRRCLCKRSRHWSASALRSTRIRAEVAREAMAAQAITVLPKPGGAISTLVSSSINRWTASACSDLSSVEQMIRDGRRWRACHRCATYFPPTRPSRSAARRGHEAAQDRPRLSRRSCTGTESVPATASSVLASIKLGIANGGCVLDGRDHGRTKIVRGQGESGCEGCPDDRCWPRHDLGRGGQLQPAHAVAELWLGQGPQ